MKHSIDRTSLKGDEFVGTCRLCGKTELTVTDFITDDCPGPVSPDGEEFFETAVEIEAANPDPKYIPPPLEIEGSEAHPKLARVEGRNGEFSVFVTWQNGERGYIYCTANSESDHDARLIVDTINGEHHE